jgi:hypothetical protein
VGRRRAAPELLAAPATWRSCTIASARPVGSCGRGTRTSYVDLADARDREFDYLRRMRRATLARVVGASEESPSPCVAGTVGSVFERYSDRARQIIVLAQEEARELGHPFIAAEHLLLGAVRAGAAGDLRADSVRTAVAATLERSADTTPDQMPFTPAAQSALERARAIAGGGQVLPAHVLLALLEDEGVAGVVERCGTPVERLRGELQRLVADAVSDTRHPVEVRVGDELLGDLGNPRTDIGMLRAILRRDGKVAGWLRTAGIDEAWVREFDPGSPGT